MGFQFELPGQAFGTYGAYVAGGEAFYRKNLPVRVDGGRVEGHGPAACFDIGLVEAPLLVAAEFDIHTYFDAFGDGDQGAAFGVGDVELQGRVRKVRLAVVRVGEFLSCRGTEESAEVGSGGFELTALCGYEESAGTRHFAGREYGFVGKFKVDEPDADGHCLEFNELGEGSRWNWQ
jgi:hypothetical protein